MLVEKAKDGKKEGASIFKVYSYWLGEKLKVSSSLLFTECTVDLYSAPDSVRTGVNYGSVFPKYG